MNALSVQRRLQGTRLRRGRLLWLALGLLVLPTLVIGLLAAFGDWGGGLFDQAADSYFVVVPLVAALLASPTLADEIENKTFTYLFARPAPRASLLHGRLVATVPWACLVVTIAVALGWLFSQLKFPAEMAANVPHLLRMELAIALAVPVYFALATLIGTIFYKHPFLASLGYFFVIESGLGQTRLSVRYLSVSWHLRALGELTQSTIALGVSVLVLVVFCIAAVVAASVIVKRAEYRVE